MGTGGIKVTDKRMFTADGELREEYRHLRDTASGQRRSGESPPRTEAASAGGEAKEHRGEPDRAPPPLEIPTGPNAGGAPTFVDLIALLAEPVAVYLGDARLPDGSTAEDLNMARLHIDLLDVLRKKTAGNLAAQEAALLEDLLYRLRLRYVQKNG